MNNQSFVPKEMLNEEIVCWIRNIKRVILGLVYYVLMIYHFRFLTCLSQRAVALHTATRYI